MADTKISALPAGTTPTGVEVAPFVQGGATVKLSVSQISSVVQPTPNYISGYWYWPYGKVNESVALPWLTAGDIAMTAVEVPHAVTIGALGCRVGTLSAGGNVALGIYANDPSLNRPTGPLLGSVSGLSTSVATAVSATLASPVSLTPGIYWLAVQQDNIVSALTAPSSTQWSLGSTIGAATLGALSPSATNIGPLYYMLSGTYPTLPNMTALTPTPTFGSRFGAVFIQVA